MKSFRFTFDINCNFEKKKQFTRDHNLYCVQTLTTCFFNYWFSSFFQKNFVVIIKNYYEKVV